MTVGPEDIDKFQEFLDRHNIFPNERIGQHFLLDEEFLNLIAGRVIPGANVIEVGSGVGNLTELLAQTAQAVFGWEIDPQFEPILTELENSRPNVRIEFRDVLKVDLRDLVDSEPDSDWQIVANPPYHISEPLLKQIASVPVSSAVLLVGDNLAAAMTADRPTSPEYTKTSFITQAFFRPEVIAEVPKTSFYPQPRTKSNVVELTPIEQETVRSRGWAIQRELVAGETRNITVHKAIKTALDSMAIQQRGKRRLSKKYAHRYDRRVAKRGLHQMLKGESGPRLPNPTEVIENLELPAEILSRPFSRLDNQAIRRLAQALMKL